MKVQTLSISNFKTHKGVSYDSIELHYHQFGQAIGNAPVVLVNHSLTGDSIVCGEKGWWNEIIGEGQTIDTNHYTILAFNIPGNGMLGQTFSSPKDFHAGDVAALFLVGLKVLGITNLFALIGGSIGGGIAWEMAALAPKLTRFLIPVAADWKANDWIIANTFLQKRILENSKNPLEDARIHAMLTYRTPKSFDYRFGRTLNEESGIYNIESWLLHHGKKLQQRFQLQAYKLMNHLLSTIDITRNEKVKFEDIISKIKGNIFIVSVDSDLFFTDYQNRETFYKACRIKENIFFKTIKSVHGHDAFLIEFDQLNLLLSQIFTKKSISLLRN